MGEQKVKMLGAGVGREAGFSLVELLVSIAVGSLVVMSLSHYILDVGKLNLFDKNKEEVESIRNIVRTRLDCQRTVAAKGPCPVDRVIEAMDKQGNVFLTNDGQTALGNTRLRAVCGPGYADNAFGVQYVGKVTKDEISRQQMKAKGIQEDAWQNLFKQAIACSPPQVVRCSVSTIPEAGGPEVGKYVDVKVAVASSNLTAADMDVELPLLGTRQPLDAAYQSTFRHYPDAGSVTYTARVYRKGTNVVLAECRAAPMTVSPYACQRVLADTWLFNPIKLTGVANTSLSGTSQLTAYGDRMLSSYMTRVQAASNNPVIDVNGHFSYQKKESRNASAGVKDTGRRNLGLGAAENVLNISSSAFSRTAGWAGLQASFELNWQLRRYATYYDNVTNRGSICPVSVTRSTPNCQAGAMTSVGAKGKIAFVLGDGSQGDVPFSKPPSVNIDPDGLALACTTTGTLQTYWKSWDVMQGWAGKGRVYRIRTRFSSQPAPYLEFRTHITPPAPGNTTLISTSKLTQGAASWSADKLILNFSYIPFHPNHGAGSGSLQWQSLSDAPMCLCN